MHLTAGISMSNNRKDVEVCLAPNIRTSCLPQVRHVVNAKFHAIGIRSLAFLAVAWIVLAALR